MIDTAPSPVYRDFIARGAVAELFRCRDKEVLLDGPAGTGKTMGALMKIHALCEMHPGIRCLLVRQTRVSMSESVLKTYEEDVLPPDHPLLQGNRARRANRQRYEYPNGSLVAVGGMNNPDRIMSTDWDVIFFAEATEGTLEGHEKLVTRLRNGRLDYQQIICDCNPSASSHWLNRRCEQVHDSGPLKGRRKMRRLISRHPDNPRWFSRDGLLTPEGEEYMGNLYSLTGYRRERLLFGRWVSAEGMIWPEFDPAIHCLHAHLVKSDGVWQIVQRGKPPIVLREFAAGVDWGYRNPGVIVVGGMDYDGNLYVVHQVYRREKDIEWWADKAVELDKRYGGVYPFNCGHEEPGHIAIFNRRLGRHPKGETRARAGETDHGHGFDVVRQWFKSRRLFILWDSLEERDPMQEDDLRPCGLIEEIPDYVFREKKEGQDIKEDVAPGVDNHSCDALRYLVCWFDRVGGPTAPEEPKYRRGTCGDWFNHDEMEFDH